jgi:hypothetical protein
MNSKLMTNKLWFMLIYYSNNFQVGVDTCIYQLNIDSMLIHQVHYLCFIVGMLRASMEAFHQPEEHFQI